MNIVTIMRIVIQPQPDLIVPPKELPPKSAPITMTITKSISIDAIRI